MYCKLFASLYQGTLRGRSDEILVFTNLLANADKNGHVDKHFRAIAEETGLTTEKVKAAIVELESPDPESRSPKEGGARLLRMDEHRIWGWHIVNYTKYREIRNHEDRAEANRLAQARFRNKRNESKPPSAESKQESAESKQSKPMQRQEVEAEATPPPTTPPGKPSASGEAIGFADWFKGLLPPDLKLTPAWQKNWAKVYDDLIRLDHRTKKEIFNVCTWARQDPFWSSNFMSPTKLRERNKDGVLHFDYFVEKMKEPPKGANPRHGTEADHRAISKYGI